MPGQPQLLRAINERRLLELIRSAGSISRAEIARASGLSKPTVSLALAGLVEAGLVHQIGQSSGGKGPRALLYELNPGSGWVVGIDVGRQWVRAAAADITGEIRARRDARAKARSTGALVAQIGEIAHQVAGDAGLDWASVTHATVGSPGVLDPARERLEHALNLPGWGRQGLVAAIREQLGTIVTFENDVNLAALGERFHGLGRDVDDFVFVSVGTGVGMGIVIGGELYRGAGGAAGEIAYLPVDCSAESRGARPGAAVSLRGPLEEAAAASGLVAHARRLGMKPPVTAKAVFAAARRGDARAAEVVAAEARRIAVALSMVTPVLNPELVILGGGIARDNGDLLLGPIDAALRSLSPFGPRLVVSELGEEAVLTGAVATALAAAQDRLFSRGELEIRESVAREHTSALTTFEAAATQGHKGGPP